MRPQNAARKNGPDDATFQELLAAAYTLQQHNERLVAKSAKHPRGTDAVQPLTQIVEIQNAVLDQQLDFSGAAKLIAERLRKIIGIEGIAIATVEGDILKYVALAGTAVSEGAFAPVDANLSAECIRTGQILRCADTAGDPRVPEDLCRKKEVRALVSLPISYDRKVRGVFELRSASPRVLEEHELRLCQLMVGLLVESIARAAEADWKRTIAAEHSSLLKALEELKPQLEKLAGGTDISLPSPSADFELPAFVMPPGPKSPGVSPELSPPSLNDAEAGEVCLGCGHAFEDKEQYCGNCGTARKPEKAKALQSKWATLWHMQEATMETEQDGNVEDSLGLVPDAEAIFLPDVPDEKNDELPLALREIVAKFSNDDGQPSAHKNSVDVATNAMDPLSQLLPIVSGPFESPVLPGAPEVSTARPASLEGPTTTNVSSAISYSSAGPAHVDAKVSPWSSARKAREWFESLDKRHPIERWLAEQWHEHRGVIYIGMAVAVLLLAFLRSAPSSSGPNTSSVQQHNASMKPKLTFLETMLVDLGLAEPPPAPDVVYLGDPNIQVWVDLHTALYYCPGSDLFGKTAGGKFVSQRDAQQDRFEPAFRKACN